MTSLNAGEVKNNFTQGGRGSVIKRLRNTGLADQGQFIIVGAIKLALACYPYTCILYHFKGFDISVFYH